MFYWQTHINMINKGVAVLLEYDTTSLGNSFTTIQEKTVVSSSRVA
jgi:hypothetical protein